MKILQCMSSVAPEKGGPSAAVRNIAHELALQGHQVTVIGHDDGKPDTEARDPAYSLIKFPLTTKTWQFSARYILWVLTHITEYDAVLINSLFLSHTALVTRIARARRVPYVVRPHGSLNESDLQKNARAKRIYLRLIDLPSLRRAKFIFCTSATEAAQASRFHGLSPVMIPLGAIPSDQAPPTHTGRRRHSILFLGRVTQKKGVDVLLLALEALRRSDVEFHCTIVGPADTGLAEQYASQAQTLGLTEQVEFRDFAGPAERAELLASAGVFVLPSLDENFGISVAEALAAGLPVVITPGVSHAEAVRSNKLGLVTDRRPTALADALREIISMPTKDFQATSFRCHEYARSNYQWSRTATRLVEELER